MVKLVGWIMVFSILWIESRLLMMRMEGMSEVCCELRGKCEWV